MATLRSLERQVFNSGEPRHFSGWEFPGPPKIDRSGLVASPGLTYQRQRAFAPQVRTRALDHLLRHLRLR